MIRHFHIPMSNWNNTVMIVFYKCGDGLGSTYVGALPGLRIDYVLGDIKSIEFCSHKVLRFDI